LRASYGTRVQERGRKDFDSSRFLQKYPCFSEEKYLFVELSLIAETNCSKEKLKERWEPFFQILSEKFETGEERSILEKLASLASTGPYKFSLASILRRLEV